MSPEFSLLCSVPFGRLLLKADLLPQGPVTVEQLQRVEQVVQDVIKRNEAVHMAEVPLALARRVQGLRAMDEVRQEHRACFSEPAPSAGIIWAIREVEATGFCRGNDSQTSGGKMGQRRSQEHHFVICGNWW